MTLLTKKQYREELAKWLEKPSMRRANALFTVNVTFEHQEIHLSPDDWLSLYRKSFMSKLNRQLTRKRDGEIAKSLGAHYERETKSMYKAVEKGSPHHVHDLVVLPIGLESKIWDASKQEITSHFQADLHTSKAFSDWKIVPLTVGTAHTWLTYISKGNESSGF